MTLKLKLCLVIIVLSLYFTGWEAVCAVESGGNSQKSSQKAKGGSGGSGSASSDKDVGNAKAKKNSSSSNNKSTSANGETQNRGGGGGSSSTTVPKSSQAKNSADLSTLMIIDPNQLLEMWEKGSRNERSIITEALIEKKTVSVPVLRDKIVKGKKAQRIFAIKLLTEMRDRGAVPNLIKALSDPEKQMRIYSINSLREINDSGSTPELRKKLKEVTNKDELACILFALGKLGNRADIRTLEQYLDHSEAIVRLASASAMAMLGDAKVTDILINLSQSKEPFIQKTAIKSLGYLNTPESTQRLESILTEVSANWKSYAEISLQQQRLRKVSTDAEKLKLFSDLVKNKNERMAEWAVGQISEIDTPEALEVLLKISKSNIRSAPKAKRILKLRMDVAK